MMRERDWVRRLVTICPLLGRGGIECIACPLTSLMDDRVGIYCNDPELEKVICPQGVQIQLKRTFGAM